MYLWKQWHESRIISALGLMGLILLAVLVIKGVFVIDAHAGRSNGSSGLAQYFVFIFYLQAALIGCWAWLVGSIGAGKNLGEDSGSFLFTRPRTRAWFLWHDWAYGIVGITIVTALCDSLLTFFCYRVIAATHVPQAVIFFPSTGQSIDLLPMTLLVAAGVWLFAALVYSLTYASTIVAKRSSGVILARAALSAT